MYIKLGKLKNKKTIIVVFDLFI